MSWLVESPALALSLGGIASAILLIAFFQSGRVVWLGWIGVVLLVVAALWGFERLIVTDREQIENTFYAAAAGLESGDAESVLSHVAASATALRNEIASRMRGNHFDDVRITDLKIEFADREPTAAQARAAGHLSIRSAGGLQLHPFGRVRFALIKEDDRWLFTGYELERGS